MFTRLTQQDAARRARHDTIYLAFFRSMSMATYAESTAPDREERPRCPWFHAAQYRNDLLPQIPSIARYMVYTVLVVEASVCCYTTRVASHRSAATSSRLKRVKDAGNCSIVLLD